MYNMQSVINRTSYICRQTMMTVAVTKYAGPLTPSEYVYFYQFSALIIVFCNFHTVIGGIDINTVIKPCY